MGCLPRRRPTVGNFTRRNSTPHIHLGAAGQTQRVPPISGVPFQRINSFPMTVDHKRPRAKFSGNMDLFNPDYHFSPGGDHVLPNSDLTMYAASPNSLHMYDQEKYDMQNYVNCLSSNTRTPQKRDSGSTFDEFDLNPQFENNYDMLPNLVMDNSDLQPVSDFSNYNAQTSTCMNSDVTLTELNSNWNSESESLLDDLETIIPSCKTVSYSDGIQTNTMNQNSFNVTGQRQNNTNFPSNSQNVSRSNFQAFIKSEPMASSSLWPNPCKQSGSLSTLNSNIRKETPVQLPQSMSRSPPSVYYNSQSDRETVPKEDNKILLQKLLMTNSPSERPPVSIASVIGLKRPALPVKEENEESVEEKWKEIEKYIHDEDNDTKPTQTKRTRFDSGSSVAASFDEESIDDDESSDEDWSDTEMDFPSGASVLDDGKKGEKYFWQYNVQSKGPKGTKLKLHLDNKNPYKLPGFEDPVFDPQNTKAGIRHGGKARKGDGNDIVPSPKKLFNLGQQIRKLNHMINEVSPSNDQPASIRNESRKKKNKLASRACRLKKKAQHEANKVKLYGLEKEHSQLLQVITTIKSSVIKRARQMQELKDTDQDKLINKLDELIAQNLTLKIAGNAAEFVNSVIKAVENGDVTGGIVIEKKKNSKK
ncbi:hypothetical protein SNE40_007334 [Patella caerulea]|uniref:BZIP domain-containing protein n=1 Tax=Patella caerulea TaxID=87958 RepID=A0AAN8K4E5_PATCE